MSLYKWAYNFRKLKKLFRHRKIHFWPSAVCLEVCYFLFVTNRNIKLVLGRCVVQMISRCVWISVTGRFDKKLTDFYRFPGFSSVIFEICIRYAAYQITSTHLFSVCYNNVKYISPISDWSEAKNRWKRRKSEKNKIQLQKSRVWTIRIQII